MCLEKLAKFKPCKVGYKIMKIDSEGNLRGEFYTEAVVLQDAWLNEKNYRSYIYRRGRKIKDPFVKVSISYPYGWHVYHREAGALSWRAGDRSLACVKVEVREPVAVGYQCSRRITVAKQIKIIGIVDER